MLIYLLISQAALASHIIRLVLEHRNALYAIPELADFNGNGGSRINGKIQQQLKKFEKLYSGAEGSTAAAVDGMKKNKSPGNSPKKETAKSKGKGGGSPAKKRKTSEDENSSE